MKDMKANPRSHGNGKISRPPLSSMVWPRAGWRRVVQHVWKRIRRLKDTPHAIAAGFTAGIVVSFTPLLGLHVILACLLAWALRGNIIAALLGTMAGNPLTFPFIWALLHHVGARMSGLETMTEDAPHFHPDAVPVVEMLLEEPRWSLTDVFATMMLGSVPVCLLLALVVYPATLRAVGIYQKKRQKRQNAKNPVTRSRSIRARLHHKMEKP